MTGSAAGTAIPASVRFALLAIALDAAAVASFVLAVFVAFDLNLEGALLAVAFVSAGRGSLPPRVLRVHHPGSGRRDPGCQVSLIAKLVAREANSPPAVAWGRRRWTAIRCWRCLPNA